MSEPKTYSEATIEQLTAENADLKKRVKELDAECEAQQYQFDILKKDPACVWANMLRGNIATPSALVEAHDYQQIKSENSDLRAKLAEAELRGLRIAYDFEITRAEQAESKCAEMHHLITHVRQYPEDQFKLDALLIRDDCGKGWRSPEDYAALVEKLDDERKLRLEAQNNVRQLKTFIKNGNLSTPDYSDLLAENRWLRCRVEEVVQECGKQKTHAAALEVGVKELENILKLEEEHRLAVEAVRDGLEAKVKVLREILTDYRTKPNCGEYGVTQGWIDRVESALS